MKALRFLLLLPLLAGPALGQPLPPGVWALDGHDPNLPLDDLEPLRSVVGNASVVALGETIHTSGGFYRMKHRAFRFLVERMGFRAFAIESPWDSAQQVARFVETCEGSAAEAVEAGLFAVWASEEVRDLVQWMCNWNRAHPGDRVVFFGFDIQQPAADTAALTAFLRRIGLPENDSRIAGIGRCAQSRQSSPAQADHAACIKALKATAQLFTRERRSIVQRTSPEDFEWAKLRRTGLEASQNQIYFRSRGDSARSFTARDQGMAAAFRAIRSLRAPGAKTALWAHNLHIGKGRDPVTGAPRMMGGYLKQALGRTYVSLALIAHEISIDWINVLCGQVPQELGNSVEQRLHDLGVETLLVDLDFPGGRPPLLIPGRQYRLGDIPLVPRQQFDGLFYLEVSPQMNPLELSECSKGDR